MPLFNPPSQAGGGSNVTVDANGFITVAGTDALPFKNVSEDMGNGLTRIHHIVKHPSLGEISIAFTDIQA